MLNIPNNLPHDKGVFAFVCNENGRAMICFSGISMKEGASLQLSQLRGGYHSNRLLQADYDKYGEDAFHLILLERQPKDIGICKHEWMKKWENNYNLFKSGKEPHERRTPEWRKQQSLIMTGRKVNLSEEGRMVLVLNSRGENNVRAKLTEKDVHVVKRLLNTGMSAVTIAEMFNVHKSSIYNIGAGRTWGHLQ